MSPDIAPLLARVGAGVFQNAWVVEDIAAAESSMRAGLGCSDFTNFVMSETWNLRGELVTSSISLAFGRAGNVQIELMQPLEGCGVAAEFLERHGPGFHHLGTLVPDLDAAVGAAAADGVPAVMTGSFAAVRICFLDTYDAMGFYVELIEDPTRMLWATRPWRDVAIDR